MMGPPHSCTAGQADSYIEEATLDSAAAGSSCSQDESSTDAEELHPAIRQRKKVNTTLGEMTKKIILQKIHLFDTFGITPFSIVRPILEQCTAKKLWSLEEQSPHLLNHTNYIWKRLCLKEFRDLAQAHGSGDLEEVDHWRALFEVRHSAQLEALEAAAARVKEKYASLEANRVAHRMRVVAGTPALRSKPVRGKGMGASNISAGNQTPGQRLLSKARKQGNARMQMTTAIRNPVTITSHSNALSSSTSSSLPPLKRPRTDDRPAAMSINTNKTFQPQQGQSNHQHPPQSPVNPSNIFITKRRIATGVSSNHTKRY
ncbi:hypothetical protein CBS101457_004140 [Exobasidium rhododendri]|nr:hypothetical protein CBS101457_004140 [Exobasidium rhododendri]